MRELADYVDEDPDELIPWLREGAREFGAALREVGPNMRVWTPIPGGKKTPEFFARRFAHETVVHRADAALALGADFEPAHDLAVDCVDEWLDLAVVTWPRLDVERHRALHGPTGRCISTRRTRRRNGSWTCPARTSRGGMPTRRVPWRYADR